MNMQMWQAAITQENVAKLQTRGVYIFGPKAGELACGEIGNGKMLEPAEIMHLLPSLFANNIFANKKIVITAGPTIEAIDPVRYISNHSSGKMGYALAQAAQEFGAEVVLISGPTNLPTPEKVKCIHVQTANEMHKSVFAEVETCDIFIAAAAVSDYRPVCATAHKIKKSAERISLELEKNPDILLAVSQLDERPIVVGFAAETENLVVEAKAKLIAKKVDMIIANQVGANCGFNCDENKVVVLQKNQEVIALPLMRKTQLARELLQIINRIRK
jgi:phosphopantothenoylcysteine decarboxylase / phosphopantothenate---cysteine ligase